jgi:hypothetical protein
MFADIWENQWNNNYKIIVHGGIVRRPQLTKEGFVLALCHELGHLLGGYPLREYTKYASEGQADYYATHVCAKKVFGKMAKESPLKLQMKIDICDKSFDTKIEIDTCYLTVFGAKSLADTIAQITQEYRQPEIELKDGFIAKATVTLHSAAQCRLDTYMAGLLCEKLWDDKLIPYDRKNATCINRPRCWFAP